MKILKKMFVILYLFIAIPAQLSKDTYQKLRRFQDISGMSNEEFENLLFRPSHQGFYYKLISINNADNTIYLKFYQYST